jgi:DNA-binding PadR family transcriptional regulator
MQERTELENCVLGVVWLRGPCTAYMVRLEFLASESSHWTGSAGSIYPLVRRLAAAGLIRSRHRKWGSDGKREYSITRAGKSVLRRWIGPPLPPWTAAPAFDPLRTRLSFLGALEPSRRKKFLAEGLRNLDAELEVVRKKARELDRTREPFEYLVVLGTIYELEGRKKWIRAIVRQLPRRA